jgi:hypothetical protein
MLYKNNKKYSDFLKWNVDLSGIDNVNISDLSAIFKRRYIISNFPSKLFDTSLYDSFKRYFKPTFHSKEEGIEIVNTPEIPIASIEITRSLKSAEAEAKKAEGAKKK